MSQKGTIQRILWMFSGQIVPPDSAVDETFCPRGSTGEIGGVDLVWFSTGRISALLRDLSAGMRTQRT